MQYFVISCFFKKNILYVFVAFCLTFLIEFNYDTLYALSVYGDY